MLVTALTACASDAIVEPPAFKFASMPGDSVFVGRTIHLTALSSFDDAVITASPLNWSSTDTAVARVTADGRVFGVGVGAATITIALDGKSASTVLRVVPRRVDGGAVLDAMSSGSGAACAIRTGGSPLCLPYNTADSGSVMTPWASAGNPPMNMLSTAEKHDCGLSATGLLYCAGVNVNGQLLNGRTTTQRVSTAFETGGGQAYRFVSAGGSETAGFTCAIRAADSVTACAGRNFSYQTGHTPLSDFDTLVAPVTGGFKALTLSAGRNHTCAVALDRSLYCWGTNDHELFGVPRATMFSTHIPQKIPGGLAFTAVSSGSHTCAISTGEELYCWGSNESGQLGVGLIDTMPHSTPQKISLGAPARMVLAGNGFTCALTTTGTLYCWGLIPGNSAFRSLYGNTRYSPVRLAKGLTFKSISANAVQVCGVTTDGRGVCL